jgi:8-oxo-dGTP diphosphatase
MDLPIISVAICALINSSNEILLAKSPKYNLWEFPGGKLEENETPEQAVSRELSEELGIKVAFSDLKPITFTSFSYSNFYAILFLFFCSKWQGEPKPIEGQELKWVNISEIDHYPMHKANEEIIATLKIFLS